VLLVAIGLGMIFARLGDLLERPFARLSVRPGNPNGGGFLLGLGLGLVYVPCAGPVLTAIAVAGAAHQLSLSVVVLTLSFAIGATLPLLGFALAGRQVGEGDYAQAEQLIRQLLTRANSSVSLPAATRAGR
jgi:cytochrome c biogenesis protein CcdA